MRSTGSTRCSRSFDVARLPFSLKILLENLLRNEDGESIRRGDIEALASWDAKARAVGGDRVHPGPSRDAGLHRGAGDRRSGGDARRDGRARRRPGEDQPAGPGRAGDRPLGAGRRVRHRRRRSRTTPSSSSSATRSATRSCAGDRARFDNFKVVPPDTGIVHQVNLEYLARVVFVDDRSGVRRIPTRSSGPTRTRR